MFYISGFLFTLAIIDIIATFVGIYQKRDLFTQYSIKYLFAIPNFQYMIFELTGDLFLIIFLIMWWVRA